MTAANTTVPAPATPAAPTLDGVLAKGEELRARVHEEIEEHRETYRRNAGGLRAAPLYAALRESVSAERARELAEGYRERPDDVVAPDEGAGEIASEVLYASDALLALARAYRRAAIAALARASSGGFAVPPRRGGYRQPWAPGSHGEACGALDEAQECFPTEWLRRSRAVGVMKATMGERGLYRSWPKPGYPNGVPLQPLAKARIRVGHYHPHASAVHELAHRFQDVVPGLALLEGDYYLRRTTRSDGTRAPALRRPGYREDDLFRDGGFFSSYCGRAPHLDAEEPSPAYEILAMGMEAMLGGEAETFERFYLHALSGDREHEAFVLGALATL